MIALAQPSPHILLGYQQRWHEDRSQVRVWAKSRRIGASWGGLACEAVLEAAAADGMDQWYLGYEQEMTREFILDCAHFARVFGLASGEIGEGVLKDGERDILTFSINFASGYRVNALSSKPRNIRSRQGHVILDEAAYVDDLPGFLKSALAMDIWGGRVSIVSSHNGVDNAFNQLVEDIKAGRKRYSLHVTTFDDAIADGLYKRVCLVKGWPWSQAAEDAWRNRIVDNYGAGADEELFCIPNKSGGAYINRVFIEARMRDAPIVRLELDDEFTMRPAEERKAWLADWFKENVAPLMLLFDPDCPTFYGQDFGRTSDLSVIAPSQLDQKLRLVVPWLIEMRNVPYDQQMQLLEWIVKAMPNFTHGKVDGTGNGRALGEFALQTFGAMRFESVQMSERWYAEHLPPMKASFEDDRMTVPRDLDVLQDIAAIRVIDGVPKLPKAKTSTRSANGKRVTRHGDAAIALALTHAASRSPVLGDPVIESAYSTGEGGRGVEGGDLDDVWGGRARPRFGGL